MIRNRQLFSPASRRGFFCPLSSNHRCRILKEKSMNFLYRILATYEYSSLKEFFQSMFPSWKYHLQNLSLLLSGLSAGVSYLFGFRPALAIAILVAIIAEVWTGINASKKEGKDFESFRFSRCLFKLAIWAILFYVIHQFENEYADRTHILDMGAFIFFKILFLFALSFFVIEHVTSILENIAVISGKPKTALIGVIQDSWKKFTDTLKGKIS